MSKKAFKRNRDLSESIQRGQWCKDTEGELSFFHPVTPSKKVNNLEAVDTSQQGAEIRLQVTSWGYMNQEIVLCGLSLKHFPQVPWQLIECSREETCPVPLSLRFQQTTKTLIQHHMLCVLTHELQGKMRIKGAQLPPGMVGISTLTWSCYSLTQFQEILPGWDFENKDCSHCRKFPGAMATFLLRASPCWENGL